jgi:hypothetical protein
MADYLPRFEGMPAGLKVNTEHADYQRLVALASEEGLSQKAFGRLLQLEASRVAAAKPAPVPNGTPAPAPAKPALPENFDKLPLRHQFAYGLANPTRSNRGQS